MDTEWFAVDEHGNVALFDTAEDGALPTEAAHDSSGVGPNFDVLALTALRVVHLLEGGVDPGADAELGFKSGRALFCVDLPTRQEALELSSMLVPQCEFLVLGSRAPWILMSRTELPEPAAHALRASEEVRWLVDEWQAYELFFELEDDDGLFHFQHFYDAENEEPALYQRTRIPKRLLRIPEELNEALNSLRRLELPVDFSRDHQVNLRDHLARDEFALWGDPYELTPEQQAQFDAFIAKTEEKAVADLKQVVAKIEREQAPPQPEDRGRALRLVIACLLLALIALLAKWKYG